jgi:hypothetical protein
MGGDDETDHDGASIAPRGPAQQIGWHLESLAASLKDPPRLRFGDGPLICGS